MKPGFADICREVCQRHGWELLPTGVVVGIGKERKQLVVIESFEFEQERLVRLSSSIGPVTDMSRDELVTALRSNAEIAHGAIAICDDQLALVDTLLMAGIDAEALSATIEFLARRADEMERVVFGTDDH